MARESISDRAEASREDEMPEPEENEFLDYAFGV